MESKVIGKKKNISVKKLKIYSQSEKKSVPGLLQNFLPNPGTFLI